MLIVANRLFFKQTNIACVLKIKLKKLHPPEQLQHTVKPVVGYPTVSIFNTNASKTTKFLQISF